MCVCVCVCVASFKTVRVSATFGSRFIVLSYRTHQYKHLEENNMPLAALFTEI